MKKFPNAELIIKLNNQEYADFIFEVKFTSEGKWIIEMKPKN